MSRRLYIVSFDNIRPILALLVFALISSTKSNPIRRYSSSTSSSSGLQSNNIVIHAQIGDYVNISCWFDPKLLMRANYEIENNRHVTNDESDDDDIDQDSPLANLGSFGLNRRRKRAADGDGEHKSSSRHQLQHQHRRHHRSHRRRQLDASRLNLKQNANEPFLANSRLMDHIRGGEDDETSLMPPAEDEATPGVKSYNVESSLGSSANGKYEIDWFFLDKHGRMNIISYGNKTRSNFKYKTFVNAGKPLSQSLYDTVAPISYSSSALYSQSSSYLPSPSSFSSSSSARSVPTPAKSYTHYLSAYIESEDDEGVYQCINPDWPNFIIRNITVLIGKNSGQRSIRAEYVSMLLSSVLLGLLLTRRLNS